jgi:hypothetical protein
MIILLSEYKTQISACNIFAENTKEIINDIIGEYNTKFNSSNTKSELNIVMEKFILDTYDELIQNENVDAVEYFFMQNLNIIPINSYYKTLHLFVNTNSAEHLQRHLNHINYENRSMSSMFVNGEKSRHSYDALIVLIKHDKQRYKASLNLKYTKKYKKLPENFKFNDTDICPISAEKIDKDNDAIVCSKCKNIAKVEIMDEWLCKNKSCPFCRQSDYEFFYR